MNIETFMNAYDIRTRKTVYSWIKKGYIPGADIANDYIPDSARPPYTKARAKNAAAVYCSMTKAAFSRRHIFPQLYNMCCDEFNGYIQRLIQAGLIVSRVSDGITYYDSPLTSSQCNRTFILDVLERTVRGTTQGVTEAMLNR